MNVSDRAGLMDTFSGNNPEFVQKNHSMAICLFKIKTDAQYRTSVLSYLLNFLWHLQSESLRDTGSVLRICLIEVADLAEFDIIAFNWFHC